MTYLERFDYANAIADALNLEGYEAARHHQGDAVQVYVTRVMNRGPNHLLGHISIAPDGAIITSNLTSHSRIIGTIARQATGLPTISTKM